MKTQNSKLKIKFTIGAFDKDLERAGLHDCRKYTRHVAQMNKAAEVLDRYDDFSSLTLESSDYAQRDTEYGIKKTKFHFGDERLLPHQLKATQAFLKELRGFGLLADVVGSGKTYEACAVLSELAAKGKISSALIIVPSQVYNTWISVLEEGFGLGKGVLKTLGSEFTDEYFESGSDGMMRPTSPIIVKTEDFVKWREHDVANVLFDVVVVDEAHNLCGEEGSSAKAMKLLSIMMVTKKKAKKTYCVLLSATPHSGNLENMFRLWYFIRCKGGLPTDFDEKDDVQRTEEYRKEKQYYKTHICRGATTVMDFINKVKLIEVTENFGEQFDAYLASLTGKDKIDDFDSLLEGEKKKVVDDFLDANEKIKEKVMANIANAYHNGVLRSIMIRQPNDRIKKGKRIENIFFFHATKKDKQISIKGLNGKNVTLVVDKMSGDGAIKTADAEYSVREYVEESKGNMSYHHAFADLFFNEGGILQSLGLQETSFKKTNSMRYYWQQMRMTQNSSTGTLSNDVGLDFRPVYDKNVFGRKLETLKAILTKHKDSRVIVFFDYDVEKAERCYDDVLAALKADSAFSKRIIVGDSSDKSVTEKKFNEKDNAILVVTTSAFTEGANLQKSNVIVNFQVTPNPLGMEQSIGRIFRLGQENDVTIYSLADMCKLEGYVLMYFTRIGLMTSNSGDAAIIAGSNNDNMVTIRCPACGKVKLLSKEDYEAYKKNGSDEIYCADNECCRQDGPEGKLMVEINSNEVKCESCGNIIKRQNGPDGGQQYHCMSVNSTGSGVLCYEGEQGNRKYYCRKICSISHCDKFISGPLKGKCEALKNYLLNPSISDASLMEYCEQCAHKTQCPAKCRVGVGIDAVKGCANCSEATCFPKPSVIDFDDKWEADCPVCKANGIKGRLKPVVARTFETYIRSAYEYQLDGGKAFCDNLTKEANKVAQIQAILANDKVRD